MKISFIPILFIAIILLLAFSPASASVGSIFFPTDTSATFTDCFGDGRTDHSHEGIDIMGKQMMPLYSAIDGRVKDVVDPEASWGYAITLEDSDGNTYHYIHINNDTPGTDDGKGGIENAYAPGIKEGASVTKGQLIGYMGDSGNAESVGHHLHFEIRLPDDTPIDPYPILIAALTPEVSYDPGAAKASSSDINIDKNLPSNAQAACQSGSRIKLPAAPAVYYCGADGKRYVFPNENIYFSWYDDFSGVTEITAEVMASIPLGGNVTYRPGVQMVKIQTDPKVYAVSKNGVLRWIRSGETAAYLYGPEWKKEIDDVPDLFFMDYSIGEPI